MGIFSYFNLPWSNQTEIKDPDLDKMEKGLLNKEITETKDPNLDKLETGETTEPAKTDQLKRAAVIFALGAGVIGSTVMNPHSALTGYVTKLFTAVADPIPTSLGTKTRYCAVAALVGVAVAVDYSGKQFLPWEVKLTYTAGMMAITVLTKDIKAFVKPPSS